MMTKTVLSIALACLFCLFANSQNFQWVNAFQHNSYPSRSFLANTLLDSDFNLVSAGCFSDTMDFDPGSGTNFVNAAPMVNVSFISKMDTNGNLLATYHFNPTQDGFTDDFCTDLSGNYYLLGFFNDTLDLDFGPGVSNLIETDTTRNSIFIAKYDPGFNLIWARKIEGEDLSHPFNASSIQVENNGNVTFAGCFKGSIDLDPGPGVDLHTSNDITAYIGKLNVNGDFIWGKTLEGATGTTSHISNMLVDNLGFTYVSGAYNGTIDFDPGPSVDPHTSSGGFDLFVLKFDVNGMLYWSKTMTSNMNERFQTVMQLDNFDRIQVFSVFQDVQDVDFGPGTLNLGNAGFSSLLQQKIDFNGDLVWAKNITATTLNGSNRLRPRDMVLTPAGTIIFSARMQDTLDIDPGPGVFNISAGPFPTSFIGTLTSTGDFAGGYVFNSPSNNGIAYTRALVAGPNETIYHAGNFTGEIDFDPGTGTSALSTLTVGDDIYHSKIGMPQVMVGMDGQSPTVNFSIFPNPGKGQFQIDIPAEFHADLCEVIGTDGRVILQVPVTQNQLSVDLNCPPGLYLIRVRNKRGESVVQKWISNK